MIEVEMKFATPRHNETRTQIASLGAELRDIADEEDCYLDSSDGRLMKMDEDALRSFHRSKGPRRPIEAATLPSVLHRILLTGLLSEAEEEENGGPNSCNRCPLACERVAHTWRMRID